MKSIESGWSADDLWLKDMGNQRNSFIDMFPQLLHFCHFRCLKMDYIPGILHNSKSWQCGMFERLESLKIRPHGKVDGIDAVKVIMSLPILLELDLEFGGRRKNAVIKRVQHLGKHRTLEVISISASIDV